MALFKILQGVAKNLPSKKTEGYCYVTTDEGKFYVDITGTKRICLNAEEADKFSSTREIKLTGNVTGSASSDGESGWSIATTIPSGVVTNAMLAGSIANNKLTLFKIYYFNFNWSPKILKLQEHMILSFIFI